MAHRFIEGECYFTLEYLDRALKMPYVRTFVFVRSSAFGPEGTTGKHWFFECVEPYEGGEYRITRKALFAFDASKLPTILKVGGLVKELRGYATRCRTRKKSVEAGKGALGS